jgi:transposase InsO family protein
VTGAAARLGVGTRFLLDGEAVEVVELVATAAGNEVVLRGRTGLLRISVRELLFSDRAAVIPDRPGPASDDEGLAFIVLGQLEDSARDAVLERAAHVREVLTGYRSGSAQLAQEGEPRPQFDPSLPLGERYAAKAAELGVTHLSVRRWAAAFKQDGVAGLAGKQRTGRLELPAGADQRWVETALEIMGEHTDESKPSRTFVIERANARVAARYGAGVVPQPSRTTAFRVLEVLEMRHPTFRLSTKRNRDIAARPEGVYGKLRPTRPGEYLLMDTTRLDVFAFDPFTLRWVQAELSVGMDWYTRCITGVRLTPVSTKSVDISAVLYQAFRPRPVGPDWPTHAVWPEHGIPRTALIDVQAAEGPGFGTPPVVPETIVVDHGKVYVSEHLTGVCQRMGISIQPARLRTGRDKGPVERFFRTLREDLLQALPGYKGPDVFSRGENVEDEAFFYLDELEDKIRTWIATVYHHRPHAGLVDPGLPGLRMSPAKMFEHGVARAGYIDVPRDPNLGFEFLKTQWRTIQHYGVEIDRRRYNGPGIDPYRNRKSTFTGDDSVRGRWPFQVDPDDITKIYFRDPEERRWHTLTWEHAASLKMPLSEDALAFARRLAASKYTYPDDRLVVADLLERWNLGLGTTLVERRVMLRLSRDQAAIGLPEPEPEEQTADQFAGQRGPSQGAVDPSDEGDDDEADLEDVEDEEDFYADALEDV